MWHSRDLICTSFSHFANLLQYILASMPLTESNQYHHAFLPFDIVRRPPLQKACFVRWGTYYYFESMRKREAMSIDGDSKEHAGVEGKMKREGLSQGENDIEQRRSGKAYSKWKETVNEKLLGHHGKAACKVSYLPKHLVRRTTFFNYANPVKLSGICLNIHGKICGKCMLWRDHLHICSIFIHLLLFTFVIVYCS